MAAGIWYSSTNTAARYQWGGATDKPLPGDYDGDGRADLAVWRPSDGTWFVWYSSTGGQDTAQWGVGGDVPIR
jgi:hypothetical protein